MGVIFNNNSVKFTATSTDKKQQYENEIHLFAEIDTEKSGFQVKGRTVDCLIYKKETKGSWWPRLTADKLKRHWVGVDFSRWRDEDDSDDEGPGNFDSDFDFSKLMNMKGGINNQSGDFDPSNINMDDLDSDDEYMPDIEDVPKN